MFEFITQQALTTAHFEKDQATEWLIDGYIAKESVTLVYSPGGGGKSIVASATSKKAAEQGMQVIYLDFDNSKVALSERKIQQKLIEPFQNLIYLHRSTATMTAPEVIGLLHEKAVGDTFKNTFIVIDSLKNFFDLNNDNKANEAMRKITNIRDAGATIFILSHTNKSGNNYQGSNNIRDAVDSMYRVEKIESPQGTLKVILNAEKERLPVVDTALTIKTDDLTMLKANLTEARMTIEDKEFVESVRAVLLKEEQLNKKQLLEKIGYDKRDKTANHRLERFEGIYWQSEKRKNIYTYSVIK